VGISEQNKPQIATRTCVVATTPWSGSSRLSQLIERTGAMPLPSPWFDPVLVPMNCRRLGISIQQPALPARYLKAVRERATHAGVCSFTVMWSHHRWLVQVARHGLGAEPGGRSELDSDVLKAWFPNPTYVWLTSRDTRSQALRWYFGRHHELTEAAAEDPHRLAPDMQEVRWLEAMIGRHHTGWNTFFALHHIEPVTVDYEDLCATPTETVRSILADMGLPTDQLISGDELVSSRPETLAVRWADRYRRARPRLSTTVGVRAVNA
jgi:LPS sulfotransferase NodH